MSEASANKIHKEALSLSGTLRDDLSVIYAIECGPYFKVGITRDPARRLEQMANLNPHDARIVMFRVVDKHRARVIEMMTHGALAEWHHRGEWFTAPIKEIRRAVFRACAQARAMDRRSEPRIARAIEREARREMERNQTGKIKAHEFTGGQTDVILQ
jgi:hypothetical protein